MKIAIIGGRTSTAGFEALGLDTYVVSATHQAGEVFDGIELDRYAVIFMTEPVYKALEQRVREMESRRLPVLTVVPSVAGSEGRALDMIRGLVERAVGTDALLRED